MLACCSLVLVSACGSTDTASTGTTTPSARATSSNSAGVKIQQAPGSPSTASSSPVRGGVVEVAYRNIAIAPDLLRVKVGTTIRWTNEDPLVHNVTCKSGPQTFASKTLSQGQTFQIILR